MHKIVNDQYHHVSNIILSNAQPIISKQN